MRAIHRSGCLAHRYTSQIPSRRKLAVSTGSSANRLLTAKSSDDNGPPRPFVFDVASLSPEARNHYNYLSPRERADYEKASQSLDKLMTSPELESKLKGVVGEAIHEVVTQVRTPKIQPPRLKPGLFSMGEEDPIVTGEDEEFEGDDITSLAHGDLEQHREMREYARIAAWEMPLLSSPSPSALSRLMPFIDSFFPELAKPFIPPSLDHPLRFRYTTYMGETHPAANKIVLEFCTQDLPGLTEAQRVKLIKLVGPRYNPEKDLVKMSCEMFETQAQNKRYLGDLVDTLIAEAKDSADTFEDVPLDFRHHKYKPKLEFPEKWKLTFEREQQLETERQQRLLAEQIRQEKGEIPDGVEVIQAFMKEQPSPGPSHLPLEVKQPKGKGIKKKMLALR